MSALAPEEESVHEKDVLAAKTRELDACTRFKVYSPMEPGKCNKEEVGTRWVLAWKMVEGVKTSEARLVTKGNQVPDLKDGLVETSGCVSLRSPHLQVIPLSTLRGWRPWSLDVKNALPQSPPEWLPGHSRRVWQLNPPAYTLNDAPVAFYRSLKRYLVNERDSSRAVDLRLQTSKVDPRLFFVYHRSGFAVGGITTHSDDLLGCGEQWRKWILQKMANEADDLLGF